MAFSSAMPHNEQSVGEYLDLTLVAKVDPARFLADLQGVLPEGFGAHGISEVPLNADSLMSLNHGHDYTIWLPAESADAVAARVAAVLASGAQVVVREKRPGKGKAKESTFDVRPSIASLAVRAGEVPGVDVRLVAVDGKAAKAREVCALLTDRPERAVVVRRDTLTVRDGVHVSLSAGWAVSGAPPEVVPAGRAG
jgi:radical SAM-linked protein